MSRVAKLDRALVSAVPGYAVAKGVLGGVVQDEELLGGLRPVIARCDDGHRIGFEVERTEAGLVIVYLPEAPSAGKGVVTAFDAGRVSALDLPPHKVVEILSFHGRGLGRQIERVEAARHARG